MEYAKSLLVQWDITSIDHLPKTASTTDSLKMHTDFSNHFAPSPHALRELADAKGVDSGPLSIWKYILHMYTPITSDCERDDIAKELTQRRIL